MVSYDPASHELDTIALPSQLPGYALPIGGISVNVPELKMAYYVGSQGTHAYDGSPVELLAYNYSDGSAVLKPVLANRWSTVNYIKAGQNDILVMLGGVDGIFHLPVSRNFNCITPKANPRLSYPWTRCMFMTSLGTRDISSQLLGPCRHPGRGAVQLLCPPPTSLAIRYLIILHIPLFHCTAAC